MSKKGTILIAVFINACLLIALLITATTSEEEVLLESTAMMHPPTKISMDSPLFESDDSKPQDSFEIKLPEQKKQETQIIVEHSKEKDSIVHELPKIEGAKEPSKIAVQEKEPSKIVEMPKQTPKNNQSTWIQVVVKKGDTLEKIAKKHDTTVKDIIALNHLPSTFLRIGQKLKVIPKKKEISIKKPDPSGVYYIVKVGDNPWTIAMKHHLKVEDLLRLNQLDEKKARRLKPGDRLRIR